MLGADHTFSSNSAKQVAKAELKELWSPDMTSCLPSTSRAKEMPQPRALERRLPGWPRARGPRSAASTPFDPRQPFWRERSGEPGNCKKRLLFDRATMYAVPGQKRQQALRKILPWKPFRTLFVFLPSSWPAPLQHDPESPARRLTCGRAALLHRTSPERRFWAMH